MEIRRIEENDIAECLKIYNYYVRNTCFSLAEQEMPEEEWCRTVRKVTEKYPFVVAHDETGAVLGYAYLSAFNERSGYRYTADLSIYVRPDNVHRQVGGRMLERIEALGKEQGIRTLISIITGENAHSIAFHEKHGFVCEGVLHKVAVKFSKEFDVCYYRKAIG